MKEMVANIFQYMEYNNDTSSALLALRTQDSQRGLAPVAVARREALVQTGLRCWPTRVVPLLPPLVQLHYDERELPVSSVYMHDQPSGHGKHVPFKGWWGHIPAAKAQEMRLSHYELIFQGAIVQV